MTTAHIDSLDDPQKGLTIIAGSGLRGGDVGIRTTESEFDIIGMNGVELLAHGIGTGHFAEEDHCPLHKACNTILVDFVKNKKSINIFKTKHAKNNDHLFHFKWDDIIKFTVPEGIHGLSNKAMEFIQSSEGFFGIRTRHAGLHKSKEDILNPDTVTWLSGPQNQEFMDMFGSDSYQKRHALFGHIYDLAKERKIKNPIYMGVDY